MFVKQSILYDPRRAAENHPKSVIFIACDYSCIQITEFAPLQQNNNELNAFELFDTTLRNEVLKKWKGKSLVHIIMIGDIRVELYKLLANQCSLFTESDMLKWYFHLKFFSSNLFLLIRRIWELSLSLGKVISANEASPVQQQKSNPNQLVTALSHATACDLFKLKYSPLSILPIGSIETLDPILLFLEGRRANDINYRWTVFDQQELMIRNVILVGCIDIDKTGNFVMYDSTGSIQLAVECTPRNANNIIYSHLKCAFACTRFEVVMYVFVYNIFKS
jgi:hypothetical protein